MIIMVLESISIQELIPQRAPFIIVDALTHFDKIFTRTCLKIRADSIFVEGNQLTEAGVMENIAQTCAARMGYINRFINSESIKTGFIGAIKNLVIKELPSVGDTLDTTIEVVSEVFALTLVNATVKAGEKLIASGEMKIAIADL